MPFLAFQPCRTASRGACSTPGLPLKLESISYTSAAVRPVSPQEIQHLLARARARNAQESVTGVLLYCDGSFHQYLEGPPDGLARVYGAISRDPLHHHIFEMLREPIDQREFESWDMGYRGTDAIEGMADAVALDALLADESMKLSGGRLLLNAFWSKGLGARYRSALAGGRTLA